MSQLSDKTPPLPVPASHWLHPPGAPCKHSKATFRRVRPQSRLVWTVLVVDSNFSRFLTESLRLTLSKQRAPRVQVSDNLWKMPDNETVSSHSHTLGRWSRLALEKHGRVNTKSGTSNHFLLCSCEKLKRSTQIPAHVPVGSCLSRVCTRGCQHLKVQVVSRKLSKNYPKRGSALEFHGTLPLVNQRLSGLTGPNRLIYNPSGHLCKETARLDAAASGCRDCTVFGTKKQANKQLGIVSKLIRGPNKWLLTIRFPEKPS